VWHPIDLPEGYHTASRGQARRRTHRFRRGLPPAFAFPRAGAGRGGGRQSDQHRVAELGEWGVADVVGNRVVALFAGEVGLVDQPAQRVGDLDGPHRVGVDLRGALKISQQMAAQSWWSSVPSRRRSATR
jgi:hypothetical protein